MVEKQDHTKDHFTTYVKGEFHDIYIISILKFCAQMMRDT